MGMKGIRAAGISVSLALGARFTRSKSPNHGATIVKKSCGK